MPCWSLLLSIGLWSGGSNPHLKKLARILDELHWAVIARIYRRTIEQEMGELMKHGEAQRRGPVVEGLPVVTHIFLTAPIDVDIVVNGSPGFYPQSERKGRRAYLDVTTHHGYSKINCGVFTSSFTDR
jgi:hypothetical protein